MAKHGRRARRHAAAPRALLGWAVLAVLYPLVMVILFSDRFERPAALLLSDDGVRLRPMHGSAAPPFPLAEFEVVLHTLCPEESVYRRWNLDRLARMADGEGALSSPMAECRRACQFDTRCRAFSHNPDAELCVLSDAADGCRAASGLSGAAVSWMTGIKRGAATSVGGIGAAAGADVALVVETFALTPGRRCAGHFAELKNLSTSWDAEHAYAVGDAGLADCSAQCKANAQCVTFSFSSRTRYCYHFRVRKCKDDVSGWISGDRTRSVLGGDFLSTCEGCTLRKGGVLLACAACRDAAGAARPSTIEIRACAGELAFFNVDGKLACRSVMFAPLRKRRRKRVRGGPVV